jgi:D-glycero-alpha-D-manno-heptose 1-phosphate guanylyltransferase
MHKDCIILCHETDKEGKLYCMREINGKPFISYLSAYLRRFHICKVIFSISTQKEEFKSYISSNRETFSFAFDFAEQEKYLGSGHAVLQSLQYSDTPDVLIMNGHTFFDVNLDDFIAWQQTKMGDVTLALVHKENNESKLTANLNEENFVSEFVTGESNKSGLRLSGMYCMFRPSFLNVNFPLEFSFEEHYLKTHTQERDFIGMISEGYFLDFSEEGMGEKAKKDFPIIFEKEPQKIADSNS